MPTYDSKIMPVAPHFEFSVLHSRNRYPATACRIWRRLENASGDGCQMEREFGKGISGTVSPVGAACGNVSCSVCLVAVTVPRAGAVRHQSRGCAGGLQCGKLMDKSVDWTLCLWELEEVVPLSASDLV
jgi:hypothetical protein